MLPLKLVTLIKDCDIGSSGFLKSTKACGESKLGVIGQLQE